MKRSKLFLGITSAVLALGTVAASKSISPIRTGYYLTHTSGVFCLLFNSIFCESKGVAPNRTCKVFIGGAAPINLYTLYTTSDPPGKKCKTKIIYHQIE